MKQLISQLKKEDLREFILCPDWAGRTALHTTPTATTAAEIISCFPEDNLEALIWSKDVLAQSPLHYARDAATANLLLDCVQPDRYIMHPSWFMRTALHEVRKLEVARVLVERLSPSKRVGFIMQPDWNGETAIDLAIQRGLLDVAGYLVENLDEGLQGEYCLTLEHAYATTDEYTDRYRGTENDRNTCFLFPGFNLSNMLKSGGRSGNNPLLYVVACQQIDVVVEALHQFSTEKVHAMVTHRNAYGISCLKLAQLPQSKLYSCFQQSLDKNLWSGFVDYLKTLINCRTANVEMTKVLHHMSNIHILTEPGSIIDYSLATRVLKRRRLEIQSSRSDSSNLSSVSMCF